MRILQRRSLLLVPALLMAMLVSAGPAMGAFGLQKFAISAHNQSGSQDVQAGSHPYGLTTTFMLNNPKPVEVEGEEHPLSVPEGDLKDIALELPPGFVGDPNATPKCSYQTFVEFGSDSCPNETVVGVATTYVTNFKFAFGAVPIHETSDPVYNLVPPTGVAADFGFKVAGEVPAFLETSVRTGGDYGLTTNVSDISQAAAVYANKVTIWGVPADPRHNALRGTCTGGEVGGYQGGLAEDEFEREAFGGGGFPGLEQEGAGTSGCSTQTPVLPLLTNPTSCGVPRTAKLSVDDWEEPGVFDSKSVSMPEVQGCEKLDFSPSISVTPDGTAGSTPTGLNVDLHVPQESILNPVGLAEADVKDTTVTLPAGVQLSPSASDGLQACSNEEIGYLPEESTPGNLRFTPGKPSCPDASKVANVRIKTPLLEGELEGQVYLAAPQNYSPLTGAPPENPFESLLALYLVAEEPQAGVVIKVAGKVTPNPVTGQLVSTFENTPQLPFSDLKLEFFGTERAPLTTPQLCGSYGTEAVFAPWSGGPSVTPATSFQITSGPNGAACSDPPPFTPGFQAGSTNIEAGAFTPFTLTMSRPDGDQTLSRVEMRMPPGLLGTLSNTKLCGEPQAAQGTCGPESLIGETVVSAGLGSDPFTVTGGKVYLTTAYGGGAYGLSIVNPAAAGPFVLDEGKPVIVRAAIFVDPHTAALRIVSDPLPTILDGIPLQIQRVNVTVSREKFTFNPTNCNKMAIDGVLGSTEGAQAAVSSSFQVTNCARLAFDPKFAVSTSGKTSRENGASLHVHLSYPEGPFDANIAMVKVELPKQLPSRLTTLQKACTAAQFESNPAGCPPASIVGHATATTPVLPVPLEGPAYFVSHGGEAFPTLIIVLQGYGTHVDLVGNTFISKAGITSSTFKTVPDVPVGTFELTLPEGKYSALAANGTLCKDKLSMPTEFIGQNGAEIHESTKISVTGCSKHKAMKAKKHSHGKKRKRKK